MRSERSLERLAIVVLCSVWAHTAQAQVLSGGGTTSGIQTQTIPMPDFTKPAKPFTPGVNANGDLNLSLPLLTVPGRGGLSFPIELQYRSGLRVDDVSSSVGGGWSFEVGGVNRVARGGYFASGWPSRVQGADFVVTPGIAPDVYTVSAPGLGGTMLRRALVGNQTLVAPPRDNGNGGFVFQGWRPIKVFHYSDPMRNPVKVEGTLGNVDDKTVTTGKAAGFDDGSTSFSAREDYSHFVLVSDDGTRYVFGSPADDQGRPTKEGSVHLGTLAVLPDVEADSREMRALEYYVRSWRLVAILGPDYRLDEVTDDYFNPPIPTGSESGSWVRIDYGPVYTASDEPGFLYGPWNKVQVAQVSRIVTPTHQLHFTWEDRQQENFPDYQFFARMHKKLTRLQLYTRPDAAVVVDSPASDRLIQEVRFTQTEGFESATVFKRLALDRIDLYGKSGSPLLGSFGFTYNGRIHDDGTLGAGPVPQGYQDWFGYFADGQGGVASPGTNVSNPEYDGTSWCLTRVDLPTGGSYAFQYENDQMHDTETVAYVEWDELQQEITPRSWTASVDSLPSDWGTLFDNTVFQGGARVKEVTASNGLGLEQVTEYSYGPGRVSGLPPRLFADRNDVFTGFTSLFLHDDREESAVYYEWIEASSTSSGSTRTLYSTPQTQPDVRYPEVVFHLVGFTLFNGDRKDWINIYSGNQHASWGVPLGSEEYDSSGGLRRRTEQEHDLSGNDAGGIFQYGPNASTVGNIWRFPSKLDAETTETYGTDGSGPQTVRTSHSYAVEPGGTAFRTLSEVDWVDGDEPARGTKKTYAYQRYPGMDEKNILSPVVQESMFESDGSAKYHTSQITTWNEFNVNAAQIWRPSRSFVWVSELPQQGEPSFPWGFGKPPLAWKELMKATSYNKHGLLAQARTNWSTGSRSVTDYAYDSSYQSLLETVTETIPNVSLTTRYTYEPKTLWMSRVDHPQGHAEEFGYDAYGRLLTASVWNEGLKSLSRAATYWKLGQQLPQYVTSFSYGQRTWVTTEFFDGLGRQLQTVQGDQAFDVPWVYRSLAYDSDGRLARTYRPYKKLPEFDAYLRFDAAYESNSNAYYQAERAFLENAYHPEPLGRIQEARSASKTADYDTVTTSERVVAGLLERTVTDESGNQKRIVVNGFGDVLKETSAPGTVDEATTEMLYSGIGRLMVAVSPKSTTTSFAYDSRGNVVMKKTSDGGKITYKYDAWGNLRFSQDAKQRTAGNVAFRQYDGLSRRTVEGEGAAAWDSLDPNSTYSFEGTAGNQLSLFVYDGAPSGDPWTRVSANTVGENLTGRLAATARLSNGLWQVVYSGYDQRGRVKAKQVLSELLSDARFSYAYDTAGNLLQRTAIVGSNANTLCQWFDYDNQALLAEAFAATSTTGTCPPKPASADVAYTYWADGGVASRQFLGGPSVPFTQTVKGQLDGIGDVEASSHPFSANYDYNPDGTISFAEFRTPGSPHQFKRYRYAFSYDRRGQMTSGQYQPEVGGDFNVSSTAYLESATYDRNGNILTLQRKDQSGVLVEDLTYAYTAGTNRLASVTNSAFKSSSDTTGSPFAYDDNGNMTLFLRADGQAVSPAYDYRNLPATVEFPAVPQNIFPMTYRYSEEGQRFSRKRLGPRSNGEHYVLDGDETIALWTESQGLKYWNIRGNGLVGRIEAGNKKYYHTDLLGSPRVVTNASNQTEEVTDFYPFGLEMPGRSLGSGTRETFTGKEEDAETGLHYFGARYYMAAYGRFISVDPLGHEMPGWTPYNYVLNNPATMVDPDGRWPVSASPEDPSMGSVPAVPAVMEEDPGAAQDATTVVGPSSLPEPAPRYTVSHRVLTEIRSSPGVTYVVEVVDNETGWPVLTVGYADSRLGVVSLRSQFERWYVRAFGASGTLEKLIEVLEGFVPKSGRNPGSGSLFDPREWGGTSYEQRVSRRETTLFERFNRHLRDTQGPRTQRNGRSRTNK